MTTTDLLTHGLGFLTGLIIGLTFMGHTLRHVADRSYTAGYQRALKNFQRPE